MRVDKQATAIIEYGLTSQRVTPKVRRQAHRHHEVELNFIPEGSLTYLLGGQQFLLQTRDFAVFWAAIPHHIVEISDSTVMHWLTLPLTFFLQWQLPDPLTQRVLAGNLVVDPNPTNTELDLARFNNWQQDLFVTSTERRKAMLLEIEARLRRLALTTESRPGAVNSITAETPQGAGFQQAQRMARFIAAHYTELLLVEQIAQVVKLHPNYAMMIFRRHFNMSILDYLTQYRVAHAQRLLLVSDKPIKDIAFESGFGSISQFYAIFKKVCGQSPKQYRTSSFVKSSVF